MKERIKYYYVMGLWTEKMVKDAVIKNKITPEDFEEITGLKYEI